MLRREKILFQGRTDIDYYQVIDMVYEGRKARVLFSGDKSAAFSGIPLDGEHSLLFDYIQRFYELVCHVRPKRLLVIGGGVYTLPTALINSLPDLVIDVVEIDAGLDAIAEGFFAFAPNSRINIFHSDGKDFLHQKNPQYDMIIVDAFSDIHIPKSLAGISAAKLIYTCLNKNGVAAINIISAYKGRNAETIEKFYKIYSSIFDQTGIYPAARQLSPWISQNFILISQKGKQSQNYGLQAEMLSRP